MATHAPTAAAHETGLITVRVARKRAEAADIVALELVPVDGGALPPFEPGAHLDLHLPGGLVRPYSLCNAPGETHRYCLGVLREPASRGGSAAVHALLAEGQTLQVSAPRNHFALQPGATRSLLLAGGIGITPLLAMAEALHAQGADFTLHYAARSPLRLAFAPRLLAAPWVRQVQVHLDDGEPAQRLDLPALLAAPAPGTHLYVCGPGGFIDAVLTAARAAGWPEAQLHLERFGAAVVQHDSDAAFEVQLGHSGPVVVVPRGQTVLQALAATGTVLASSCEQGVCGTCLTRVLDGTPDHRDQYLTPDEQAANDQFLPCCSRALSPRLVLDV
jgi:vanillate O-demethylase ferredoxin subunit